jgi:hypothetical protein
MVAYSVHHAAVLRPRLILVPIDGGLSDNVCHVLKYCVHLHLRVSPGHGTDFHHGADFRTSCGNVGAIGVGNRLVLQQIRRQLTDALAGGAF